MGCAREVTKRRHRLRDEFESAPARPGAVAASLDDVVRYLRQQDDVVVPQGSGEFLVNARFRLQVPELVAKANRMRVRQGKPEFAVADAQQRSAPLIALANGHPLFGEDGASMKPSSKPGSTV